ncbi:MAG: NAD(P)/FAD-dependent oxidoreductase [Thermoanaerobaculia bacterium]|nr:NAD(P)/FAD-dependent oxidoreductase [Thermoanaerobaculia bacterium]
MNPGATLDVAAAVRGDWDVVVVGAGPAGAMAARELARSGVQTLLVDRQSFPRAKVCGGCLNARTLALLDGAGLGRLARDLGAEPLARFELWAGGRYAAVPLPSGASLSRTALDAALLEEAVTAGASFLPGTRAALGECAGDRRTVHLPEGGARLAARVVLAADGLAGSFVARGGRRAEVAPKSLVGAAAEVDGGPEAYRPGTIYMAAGRGGYVGVVRVERGRLNLAAALSPERVRRRGLAGAVADLLRGAGLPGVSAAAGRWRGTPPLTRRAATRALERVFLLGDAAGYVEPFTGEGISWALESAVVCAPLAVRGVEGWSTALARAWEREHRRRIVRRQRWCRAVAWWLRHPGLVDLGVRSLNAAPRLARPLVAHLNAAPEGT